ncbi:hypothetical protein BH24BAC1_BH24BAC1_25510 [soil metagenome]|jgi:hypothetical protein
MTEEEFTKRYKETLDALVVAMAENPAIEPKKFFDMAVVLENISFFGPIIYTAMRKSKEKEG